MKRTLKLMTAALTALILPALSWATLPEPIAKWTDFNVAQSGNYKFLVNGGSVSTTDGLLTTGNRPSLIQATDETGHWNPRESGKGLTIAMHVSNLTATKVATIASLRMINEGNTMNNQVGWMTAADGGIDAMWENGSRNSSNSIGTPLSTYTTEYLLVLKYNGGGTSAWAIGTDGSYAQYINDVDCKGTGTIGAEICLGASSGPSNAINGLKIHSIAIWNTDEDVETVISNYATDKMKTARQFRADGSTGAEYTAVIAADVALDAIEWTKVADRTTVTTDELPIGALVKMTVTGTPTITVDADDTPPQVIAYADNPLTVKKIVSSTDAAEQTSAYIPGIVSNPSWQIWDTANTHGAVVTCTAELDGSAIDGFELVTLGDTARLNLLNTATLKIPSFGVNFYSSADASSTKVATAETAQGILPMPGKAWNDVQGNSETTPVTSLNTYGVDGTISVSGSLQMARVGIRQWKLDNTPPSGLQKGYIDDFAGNPTTLTFTNIPYSQYRVIVYMSTDTPSYKFEHVTIGGVDYSAGVGTTASATVPGSAAWGDSGPDHNANALAEGVNLLVSPVLTASECAVSATRTNGGPRATIAAIQVVDCTAENRVLEQKFTIKSNASAKISELGITTTGIVTVTLKPGAELTMDQALTLRELNIVSEGTAESPVTIKASVDNLFTNVVTRKIIGGETKIPVEMYINNMVDVSAVNSITLVADDTTEANPQTITNVITVANGKTVKLEGYFTLSGNNQIQPGGTLVINSGKTTLTTAGQGIKGTLTIAKGATLTNATNDGLAYQTAGVIVNVYGTLDMAETRWTIFANNNTLNLYAGATVTGAGEGTKGAVDVWEKESATPAINILKNGEDASDVTLSAELRCRDGKTVFDIAEGMTAVINNKNNPDTNNGGIKVTGAGTLKITSDNTYSGGTVVDAGATLVVANASALGSGSVSGTGTLIADTITLDATGYTEFSGSYGVQNSGTLIVAAGKEEGFEVPEGCILQVQVVDLDLPYTLKTTTGAGTVQLLGVNGEVVSGTTYTPVGLSGKSTWYEYLFEANPEGTDNNGGHLPNTGTSSAGMRGEDDYPWTFVDVGQTGRKAAQIYPKSPWTTTSPTFNSLDTWSASFFAKMPTTEGGVLMGFGTTQNANGFIALVRGKGENKVLLVSGGASGSSQQPFNILADFTVPNAETAYHLYTFVRTATGVEIYLDAEPWTPYNQTVTVGDGFQIGSLHGGFGNGGFVYSGELTDYTGLTLGRGGSATDTSGAVDMLRIYRRALTADEVKTLADEYSYISPNGSYSRTIDDDAKWIEGETATWTNDANPEADKLAEPPKGAVTVATTADVKMTMNLTAAKTFEALTLQGSGVTLVGGENSAVASVTGLTKVLCNATIDCGVVEMTGPVRVADGATLTLNASNAMLETMLDGKVVGTYTHHLTGPAEGTVEAPTLTYEGWDVSVEQDDTTSWVLTASRANLYCVINKDGSHVWKAGNDAGTAGEVTIPAESLPVPIYIIANGSATVTLPSGTIQKVTVSGTGTVTLATAAATTATITTLSATERATVVLPQNGVTVNAKLIANTATLGYAATADGWTVSEWLNGSYGIRIVAGTVILSGANGGYNGVITVDEDATLESSGEATVPFGKGSIENNGTLKVGGTNGQLPPVSGTGNININDATRIAGDITITGTLTINAEATMTYGSDFPVETLTIAGPSIALNYALKTSSEASTVKIVSGKTISGTATINGNLTLDAGAIIKPTGGAAVSVYGTVNLPVEGTVTIDAAEQTPFLAYIGTAPENPEDIFVTEADNLHVAAAVDATTVTLKLVNVTVPTVDKTVTDEVAAKAVQTVVDYLLTSQNTDKTVSAISNPETLSVISDASGVTLTKNGEEDTYTATLTYAFGVSDISVVTETTTKTQYVVITAKVNGATYCDNVDVKLLKVTEASENGQPVEEQTVLGATEAKAYGLPVDVTEGETPTYSIPAGVKYLAIPYTDLVTGNDTYKLKVKAIKEAVAEPAE